MVDIKDFTTELTLKLMEAQSTAEFRKIILNQMEKDKRNMTNYVSVGDVKVPSTTLTTSPVAGVYEYAISEALEELEQEKMDKKKFEYEEDKRRSFFAGVKQIGGFPIDASDYVEVTEWSNMEGVDINLQHNMMGGRIIQMTYQEWQVLKKLMKKLHGKV